MHLLRYRCPVIFNVGNKYMLSNAFYSCPSTTLQNVSINPDAVGIYDEAEGQDVRMYIHQNSVKKIIATLKMRKFE